MKHIISFFILIPLILLTAAAQPPARFEHYEPADGLPHRSVSSIRQDRKGFMWFSTYNGICRFDGQTFRNYKPGDFLPITTNRGGELLEDKYGHIWVHMYNEEVVQFNPATETFSSYESQGGTPFIASGIVDTPSGKIWLISEEGGCICVADSAGRTVYFNSGNHNLSDNRVYTVHEDSGGFFWILTGNGITRISPELDASALFLQETGREEDKKPFFCIRESGERISFGTTGGRVMHYGKLSGLFEPLETGCGSDVIFIGETRDNRILLLTSGDGFMLHDTRSGETAYYNKRNTPGMGTDRMISCYIDSRDFVWIETDRTGVMKFDPASGKVKHYESIFPAEQDIVFPPVFRILEDSLGRIWIHPHGGGFSFYDRQTDRLIPFYNESADDPKLALLTSAAYLDHQGILWLSTRLGGVEKVIFDSDHFRMYFADKTRKPYIGNEIRALYEDFQGNIWLGCKDGAVRLLDKDFNVLGFLCRDGTIGRKDPVYGMAYHITEDSKGNIWIATKGDGVILLRQKGNRKYDLIRFRNQPGEIHSLSNDNVYTVFEDSRNRIWIGTYGGGLNLFDPENLQFVNHKNNLANYPIATNNRIRTITEDDSGNILVGTTFGLITFKTDFTSSNQIEYKTFMADPKESGSLCANDVMSVYKTASGEIFIGTNGGGLCRIAGYDPQNIPSGFETYDKTGGLPSNIIHSIVEDRDNQLWLATEFELAKFDLESMQIETFGNTSRIMKNQYFSEAAGIMTSRGDILFGATYGMFAFDPGKISESSFTPYLAFNRFNVYNKEFVSGLNIDDLTEIGLKHNENYFSIEYTALDYITSKNILYTYRLEGFDPEWIYNQRGHTANYTNIPPGEYTFRIRSTNHRGQWVDNGRSLKINIKPSFWQMGIAKVLFVLLSIALVLIAFRVVFVFYRLRDKVKMETEQAEMRTRFFTDISHEIRTPLTMIVSPIENLLDEPDLPGKVDSQLKIVLKNARRMLGMVNQILDFRKIQKYHLNLQETEIGVYIGTLCEDFIQLHKNAGLNLNFINRTGRAKIWADRENVDKLLYNLISNAVKNTPPGKEINVKVSFRENDVAVEVRDEGIGMSKEIQGKLFTRFASYGTDKSKPSTGIGLSIVKEIVDRHHAQIFVESEVGKGSCFTVIFKSGLSHFSGDGNVMFATPDEISSTRNAGFPETGCGDRDAFPTEKSLPQEKQKQAVLIAEDDPDLRSFIRQILEAEYSVYEAENGAEGYETAVRVSPDFILSDIMMPGTDGIDFLKKIRANIETSHIPFILLTAKTNMADQVEGISLGADDYMTKPFHAKLLKAKIKTIISQRKKLYNRLTSGHAADRAPEYAGGQPLLTPIDEAFIRDIRQVVLENVDNDDLMIDDLVATTAMSRRVFFQKMKSLTGLSPVEFVRETRIRHAASLLETGQYRVKEVAYMAGFSDLKYFTKYFKLYYGVTPGKYGKK